VAAALVAMPASVAFSIGLTLEAIVQAVEAGILAVGAARAAAATGTKVLGAAFSLNTLPVWTKQ
jgi:hypothetical protein